MDIFCKIISSEIPSYTLYEDDLVKVFMDVNPDSNGHCLVVSKKHYTDLFDIDENTLSHILKIAKKIGNLLKEKLNCDGLTLIQNNWECEEVKHFHLHLKPYYLNKEDILPVKDVYEKIS